MANKRRIYPRRDLTNKRFGRLLVECFVEYKLDAKKRRHDMWFCKCDCGNSHIVRGNVLICGKTQSCGCLLKENYQKLSIKTAFRNKKAVGIAAFNDVYNAYKQRAKKFQFDFLLSIEEFKQYILQTCYYCGREPRTIHPSLARIHKRKTNGSITYNGLDRINSDLGYTLDNIVTCCEICNKAKRDLSLQEFREWIKDLINFNKENVI